MPHSSAGAPLNDDEKVGPIVHDNAGFCNWSGKVAFIKRCIHRVSPLPVGLRQEEGIILPIDCGVVSPTKSNPIPACRTSSPYECGTALDTVEDNPGLRMHSRSANHPFIDSVAGNFDLSFWSLFVPRKSKSLSEAGKAR
jgi:hypothetical protein